ncbi:heavy metal-binding domain-containing protein [Spirochaetia bacterium]|nr:heavy metal-binding domain-containing protein [Spirochaetia bacterium]
MGIDLETRKLRIDGMTCVNCQNKIEKKLRDTAGIEYAEVSYNRGTATVTYNTGTITIQEISSIIEQLDYAVRDGAELQSDTKPGAAINTSGAGMLIIILAAFIVLQHFGFIGLFNTFPLARAGMGYGFLFLIGALTSVHCIAMCGGINLSQCIPHSEAAVAASRIAALRPSLLYNLGRLISYTALGVIVGALGSVISFSGAMKGVVQLAAGLFMVIMGINMLGVFPALRGLTIRMPKVFARKIDNEKNAGSKGPLYIGLLNGLMPCGPLQAMQLYALSTGSPLKGGIAMFLFSLGTFPLMFGLGALSGVLSKKFTKKVMTVGAALVVILGLTMLSNGWSLSGFSVPVMGSPAAAAPAQGVELPFRIEGGVQLVNTTLASGRYAPITVQAGIPVKWTIDAPRGSINGCNNRMIIPEYNIEHTFTVGTNVVEFTPKRAGKFRYSCWMGMIRSTITVIEPGQSDTAGTDVIDDYNDEPTEPVPAGFRIPVKDISIGTIGEEDGRIVQRIQIDITDKGFVPAAVLVQQGTLTALTFNNVSEREENALLRFPAYGQELPMKGGENILGLYPEADFDFSTSDSEYYGYVKVVEDLNTVDMDAIKTEIGNFQTMIYPSDYFQSPGGEGMACH